MQGCKHTPKQQTTLLLSVESEKGYDLTWDRIQISVLPLKVTKYHVCFFKGRCNYWLQPCFLSQKPEALSGDMVHPRLHHQVEKTRCPLALSFFPGAARSYGAEVKEHTAQRHGFNSGDCVLRLHTTVRHNIWRCSWTAEPFFGILTFKNPLCLRFISNFANKWTPVLSTA